MIRQLPRLALLLALGFAAFPLLRPYALAGHSAASDWVRAEAIHAAVEGGDLLPAWLPDLYLRHGSPLPIYYAPLPYVGVELVRRLTTSPEWALKVAMLVAWIAGAAGAALAGRAIAGPGAGVATAAAFALSPYWLVDLYVRGGVGELTAFALVPWAIAFLLRPGPRNAVAAALAVAALPLAHNVTALLALPPLALVALARDERTRKATAVAAGLLLSAFFWLPALAGRGLVHATESLTTGPFEAARNLVPLRAVLPFGGGFELATGPGQAVRFGLGLVLGLGGAAGLVAAFRRKTPERRDALLLVLVALAALLLTTSLSAPLWRTLPLLGFAQFPFRLLVVATSFAAPLVGLLASRLPQRWRPLGVAAIVALALAAARPQLAPRYLFVERESGDVRPVAAAELERAARDPALVPPGEYFTLERLRRSPWTGTVGHDFLPRTVTALPVAAAAAAVEALSPGLSVRASAWDYTAVTAELAVERAGTVALHQFWFPGWKVEIDGAPRPARAEAGRGRILVDVAPGDRALRARFGMSPLRRAAAAVSALAAVAMLVALLRSRAS